MTRFSFLWRNFEKLYLHRNKLLNSCPKGAFDDLNCWWMSSSGLYPMWDLAKSWLLLEYFRTHSSRRSSELRRLSFCSNNIKTHCKCAVCAMYFTCDRIGGTVPSRLFPNVERIKFMQVTWPLPNGLKTGSFLGMAIGRHSGWGRSTLTPVCAAEQHRKADPSPYFHHRFQH
jgi:hypothetical protein